VKPQVTVDRLRPYFPDLGITRLSRQTNLDRIGIPCWASFRPNAASLSTNQGKGLTDAAAQASAVMEALEFCVAEVPEVPVRCASVEEFALRDEAHWCPDRLLPADQPLARTAQISWVEGRRLISGAQVWVPLDAVNLNASVTELHGICKTSNGLASGNIAAEATFHALRELVERDATTLWSLLPEERQLAHAMAAETFCDPLLSATVAAVQRAGLRSNFFEVTTDLDLPCVIAMVGPSQPDEREPFAICSGHACHPVTARAALNALLEAVQGRITAIAAARDDIVPSAFDDTVQARDIELLNAAPRRRPSAGLERSASLATSLQWTIGRLHAARIDPVAVLVGGARYGVAVIKVLSETLEDRDPNLHWRPGERALHALGVAA